MYDFKRFLFPCFHAPQISRPRSHNPQLELNMSKTAKQSGADAVPPTQLSMQFSGMIRNICVAFKSQRSDAFFLSLFLSFFLTFFLSFLLSFFLSFFLSLFLSYLCFTRFIFFPVLISFFLVSSIVKSHICLRSSLLRHRVSESKSEIKLAFK